MPAGGRVERQKSKPGGAWGRRPEEECVRVDAAWRAASNQARRRRAPQARPAKPSSASEEGAGM